MNIQEGSIAQSGPDLAPEAPRDEDGALLATLDECPEGGFFEVDQWLPAYAQMQDALRLEVAYAIDGNPVRRAALGPCPATSMRHGTGMIFITALIAGLPQFS